MKKIRHQARIIALQGLYQLDIQKSLGDVDIKEVMGRLPIRDEEEKEEVHPEAIAYARQLCHEAWTRRERLDELIATVSDHWQVYRMAVVDRNILRLALYELMECSDVPPRVVFDEAVELGREFGTVESPQFINGVLDALGKRHFADQGTVAPSGLDQLGGNRE